MKVVNHRLVLGNGAPAPLVRTPNVGGALKPRFLVMHYTAGRNAQESIDWMCSPKAEASAHLVIARDGAVTQLVPFDRVAWHAGKSVWKAIDGLNRCSIGIELDNPGPVKRGPGGRWRAHFGREYDDADVVEGWHKLDKVNCGWVTYTPAQMEAAVEAARAIVAAYGIEEIIRHEDISPDRKSDPGPAFPMDAFRSRVSHPAEAHNRFVVTTSLKVRSGPGTEFATVEGSPLPEGVRVDVLAEDGSWRKVDVVGEVNGANDVVGWVHGKYLEWAG